MTDIVVTFPASRLLKPETKLPNALSDETSSLYPVAPETEFQLAENPVVVIFDADIAVGVEGAVVCVIVDELVPVPPVL